MSAVFRRPSATTWFIVTLTTWLAAEAVQRTLRPTTAYAIADEIAHGSVAVLCALPLLPGWGSRVVLVALLAGTAIDVDHTVAARSLDPIRLMSLGARPPTHSLIGALLISVIIAAIFGRRAGYAALLGAVTHIVRDASAAPGVPLFAPFISDAHIILPTWLLPLTMLLFGLGGIVQTRELPMQLRQRLRFS